MMRIPKGMKRNPDGSYEGFIDAEDANKMLQEWMKESTECSIRAVRAKDERIRKTIEQEEARRNGDARAKEGEGS